MNNIWHSLIKYESHDFLSRAYELKHKRTASAGRIRDIAANFVQGREYFLNAERSSITVRPLLHYYGVLALTKGLILLISSKKDSSALKPSHGLTNLNWMGTLFGSPENFGDLTVAITKGTFFELIEATNNTSLFRRNSSKVNWAFPLPLPELKTRLTFRHIAESVADLSADYSIWSGQAFPSAQLVGIRKEESDQKVRFSLASHSDEKIVRIIFAGSEFTLNNNGRGISVFLPYESDYLPMFIQQYDSFAGIGDVHLVRPLDNTLYLNTISIYFVMAYILGMAVRYFPSTWVQLGRQTKGDLIFSLLNRSIDLIGTKYPEIVLDYLDYPEPLTEIRQKTTGKSEIA